MIVPNKFTPLDKSILGKLSHIIVEGVDEISLPELLDMRLRKFIDIGEFVLALDVLFVIGRVEMDEKGIIKYVG
ncbi:hypothetical protein EYS14_03875 [Alteromonadaceae bacterium M269]|nr:hypothetical protein EYS14_03875 [Alteromonadaceae bacterium M269]